MSLIINVVSPEGIILASDSRQSYRNKKGMARIGSDNASKIFKLSERVGIALAGPAFLDENGNSKNISKFAEEFQNSHKIEKMTVKEIALEAKKFFERKYDYEKELEKAKENILSKLHQQGASSVEIEKKPPIIRFSFKDARGEKKEIVGSIEVLSIVVAGYNKDGSHKSFIVYVPGKVQEKRNSKKKGMEYGASWVGQTGTLVRIIKGFEPRMFDFVPFAKEATKQYGLPEIEKQISGLEYAISWGTMTLQDAIDFSVLVINTTAAIQRFSDGIKADPGDIPGVGGRVDVAVITPNNGFIWVSKKSIKVGDKEVDLDDLSDNSKIHKQKKEGQSP